MAQKATAQEYTKVATKEMLKDLEKEIPKEYGYGVRHIQLVLFLLCLTLSFLVRAHLGVTIVAMTTIGNENSSPTNLKNMADDLKIENIITNEINKSFTKLDKHLNFTQSDIGAENNTESKWNVFRTYNWSKPIQEMILSSFFVGYCVMTLPTGLIAQRWGGKLPLQISLLTNGVASFVTPWLALWGDWKAVCFCRIVQGLTQAGTFPATQTLLAKWVPANERATLSSYAYAGITIGTVIGFQLGGILADSAWGWPSTFWGIGVFCIIGFIILTIFGSPSPLEHKYISDEEKNYILGFIDDGELKKEKSVPRKAIITSMPIWACFIAQAGSGVSFIFLFTQVPTYIHYILGIDVKSSGLLTSLPYVASFFTCIVFGLLSDYFINKGVVTVRNARRINNYISQVGIAICLILVSFSSSTTFVMTCLIIGTGCQIAINTGWLVNHIDLSPNYAGTIISYGNFIVNCLILVLPVLVSQIVVDVSDQHQWQIMFALMSGLALLCNAFFVMFMSSDRQPWNDFTEVIPMEGLKDEK